MCSVLRASCMKASRIDSGKFTSQLTNGSAFVAVAVLALVVRFYGITFPAIWYDEAFSVLLARYEPWQIWSITARDFHPPLYYLVLHYWIILFGDGVLAVRSLSAVADVGTVLLSIKLMSLVATRRAAWIAALLLALLPISVRYSQEVRMYALLGLWLMGATVALVCWAKASGEKRFAVIYVLLMTAAFYTHYFAALCVFVHWFYWWWGRSGAAHVLLPARSWILANGAVVLLYLPWLPHFIDHLSARQIVVWIPPVTWQAVLGLVWQFTLMEGWAVQSLPVRLVPLILVIVCAVLLIWKDNTRYRYNGLLVGYFFIPTIFLGLVSLFIPVFVPRYLVFAAVGLPLIVAVALDKSIRRPGVLALAVVIVLAAEVRGLVSVYRKADSLNGDADRWEFRLDGLAAEMKQAARPGDKIVLGSLIWYLPFIYYNQLDIQPRFYFTHLPVSSLLDSGGYAVIPKSLRWIYFSDLRELKCQGHRVWWVAPKAEASPLSAIDWEQTLTLVDGGMAASLFTLKAIPASAEAGDPATVQRPLHPAAQNCPSAQSSRE